MRIIQSLEDLDRYREEIIAKRDGEAARGAVHIAVGMGSCGIAAGAREVLQVIQEQIDSGNLKNVTLSPTGCVGLCSHEPIVEISADGRAASFDPATGFIDFPGGAKKFSIRFDAVSDRYWSLATIVPERHEKAGRPGGIRNGNDTIHRAPAPGRGRPARCGTKTSPVPPFSNQWAPCRPISGAAWARPRCPRDCAARNAWAQR